MMFTRIRADIACIMERDPAARSRFEVITCYPGLHAVVLHRFAHAAWESDFKWLGRFVSQLARWLTGIEIHPGACIGDRVFFDHAMGVVVGETAVIGDDCTIYQGVTLGGTSLYKGTKRHPTLGQGVIVGAGAKILGGFEVGDNAKIGSNAVVTKPVPAGATAVGNPARIILPQNKSEQAFDAAKDASQNDNTRQTMTSAAAQTSKPAPDNTETDNTEDQSSASSQKTEENVFSAYGVTNTDDPVVQAIQKLARHAEQQDQQLIALRTAVQALCKQSHDLEPCEQLKAKDINQTLGE